MTRKEELWNTYTEKNPQFLEEGNVTLTTAGLKKLFDQTFDRGFDAGKAAAEAMRKLEKPAPSDNPFSGFFKR